VRTKTLWIRERPLADILAGRKTVEVRAGYPNIVRLRVGDRLLLNSRHSYLVRRIGRYSDFEVMLEVEDPGLIAPDLQSQELLRALRSIYPRDKEALGVVALELTPEQDATI
jgi:ASC-1-like (ASCH) protein